VVDKDGSISFFTYWSRLKLDKEYSVVFLLGGSVANQECLSPHIVILSLILLLILSALML